MISYAVFCLKKKIAPSFLMASYTFFSFGFRFGTVSGIYYDLKTVLKYPIYNIALIYLNKLLQCNSVEVTLQLHIILNKRLVHRISNSLQMGHDVVTCL